MKCLRHALALLLLTGCAPEAAAPPTQVIVLVGGDLDVTTLEVSVCDAEGEECGESRTYDLTRIQPMRLPTSFTVWARSGAEDVRFRVSVRGFGRSGDGSTRPLARTDVIAAFAPKQTLLLPIVLSEACAGELCGCGYDGACERVCEAGPGARCVPVPEYAVDGLAQVQPGDELDALDEGLSGCPRGALPGTDGTCRDVDECAFRIDACQLEPRACVNLPPDQGRYECACPAGYAGTGVADDPCIACPGGDCTGVTTEEEWP